MTFSYFTIISKTDNATTVYSLWTTSSVEMRVNTLETERINHSAVVKFTFYTYRRQQSVIFVLNPTPKDENPPCKSRAQIKAEGIERAKRWQALIGTNGIESKADLARYLGVSRARVRQVLK